ncbi:hypothetical protein [Cupriavidus necator]
MGRGTGGKVTTAILRRMLQAANLHGRGAPAAAQAGMGRRWPELGALAAPTGGSHTTDQQMDRRFVSDNVGYSSLSATSGYLHSEEDARHEAMQARHQIGWDSKR